MAVTIKINTGNLKDLSGKGINSNTIELLEGIRKMGGVFKGKTDLEKIGITSDEIRKITANVSFAEPELNQDIKTATVETDLKSFQKYSLIVRYQIKESLEIVEDLYPIGSTGKVQVKYDDKVAIVEEAFTLMVRTPTGEFTTIGLGTEKVTSVEIHKAKLNGTKLKITPATIIITGPEKPATPSTLKGRLLSNNPSRKLEKIQILIEVANKDNPNDADYFPVGYAVTEQDGYFFTSQVEPENLKEIKRARAKVGLLEVNPIDIRLNETTITAPANSNSGTTKINVLPEKLILFINESNPTETAESDCDCDCNTLDFHEKKSLEEFSFYTVVRTTEPLIEAFEIETSDEINLEDIVDDPDIRTKVSGAIISKDTLASFLSKYGRITTSNVSSLINLSKNYAYKSLFKLPKRKKGRVDLNGTNSIDWDDKPTIYQATTIAHGHLLHFKQVWYNDGYSIGDLLYSLPLAPGQKKQIVVFDWDRKDSASNTQQLDYQEKLYNSLARDRDVNEVAKATLNEKLRGESDASTGGWGVGGGVGAAIPIPAGPVMIPLGAIVGAGGGSAGSSSTASQDASRTTTASSQQHISDRTVQAANDIRSQRSTVIQTVSQGERFQVSAEVVANYNHCHAMTMEYFEVLRHFEIRTQLTQVQECLFIPLKITAFDRKKTLRWRDILAKCVKKRFLLPGFDALERIDEELESAQEGYYDQLGIPKYRYAEEELEYLEGELYIEFQLTRPKNTDKDEFNPENWNYLSPYIGTGLDFYNAFIKHDANRDEAFAKHAGPRIAQAILDEIKFFAVKNFSSGEDKPLHLDATLLSDFQHKKKLNVSLRLKDHISNIKRQDIDFIKISLAEAVENNNALKLLAGSLRIIIHTGSMRYRTRNLHESLFHNAYIKNDLTLGGDDVRIFTPLSAKALRKPRLDDVESSNALLNHLNENLEYYHQCIWLKMDDQRRFMLMDGLIASGKAKGRSVASVVENKLIGVVGNCLVMPVSPGFQLDPTLDDKIDLFEHYYENPKEPVHISLPTKGVFAEAVMGKCNSCEKKDESRFWRWEESPIPDSPTTINPLNLPTPQNIPPVNLEAKNFPSPIINLQNGPVIPDPQGFGSLVSLLSNPNLFNNITGLTENQKNALAALQSAFGTAQFFGSKATELTNTAASLIPSANRTNAIDQIKRAKENGLLTEEQAKKLTEQAFDSVITSPNNDLINKIKAIDELIKKGVVNDKEGKAKAEEAKSKLIGKISDEIGNDSSVVDKIVGRAVESNKGKIVFASNEGETVNAEFDNSNLRSSNAARVPQNIKDQAREVNRKIRQLNDAMQTTKLFEGELLLSDFDLAKETLHAEHEVMLDELLSISSNKDFKLTLIEGHASQVGPELRQPRGTFVGNKDLSILRAEGVAQYLVQKGLNQNIIRPGTVIGDGSWNPITDKKGEDLGINRSVLIKYQFSITETIIIPELTELNDLACNERGKTRNWSITPFAVTSALEEFKLKKNFKDFIEKLNELSENNEKKKSLVDKEVVFPMMLFRIKNNDTKESRLFLFSSIGISIGAGVMFSTSTGIQESEPQDFISAQCAGFNDFNTFGWYVDGPSINFNGIAGSLTGTLLLSNMNLGIAIDTSGLSFSIGVGAKIDAKTSLGVLYEIPGTSEFDA